MRSLFLMTLVALLSAGCPPSGGGPDGGSDGGVDAGPECTSREDCEGGKICVDGVCTGCKRDRECRGNELCNPVKQVCEFRPCFGGDCTQHSDCALGEFCVQGLCRQAEGGSGECPGVTPCGTDADCPEDFRCNQETLVCEEDVGCFGDAACPDGYYCNLGTNACEQSCTPQTEDEVCPDGFRCESGRCVECTSDADCGAGLSCDLEAGRCAGQTTCFTDRDCVRPLVCNRLTGQCTESVPPCVSNDDCLEDEICDIRTGECEPAACLPDALEENDTFETAAVIEPGVLSNLTLCDREADWYRITLGAGDRISCNVNPPPLAGTNFSVTLYAPDGVSTLATGNLLVDYTVNAAGDYGLLVTTTDLRAEYSMQVLVSRGIPCEDDAFEENDAFTAARILPEGTTYNLEKCPADEDWYLVEQPRDRSLRITLTHDPLDGDLDLWAYDSDGASVIARSETTEPAEEIEITTTSAGRVFLRIVAASDVRNAYDLKVEVLP